MTGRTKGLTPQTGTKANEISIVLDMGQDMIELRVRLSGDPGCVLVSLGARRTGPRLKPSFFQVCFLYAGALQQIENMKQDFSRAI